MPSFYVRTMRVGYRNTLAITQPTNSQRLVGSTMVCPYRTAIEKQPYETLSLAGVLLGSEVRVVDPTNAEFVVGVEAMTTTTYSWTYRAPVEPTKVTLSIIKPGFHVFSQEIMVGIGSTPILVTQRLNEAYI